MDQLVLLIVGFFALAFGSMLGYYARQSIAKKRAGTIEQILQKRLQKAKETADLILSEAKEKSQKILETAKDETSQRHSELLKTERLLLKREHVLDQRISDFELKQKDFQEKVEKLKQIKESLEGLQSQASEKLEKISGLKKEEAKRELLLNAEKEYQKEILEKIRNLEEEGREKFEKRAKEILATVIQKCAISQAQEITTTTFALPSEEIKGRIIGKEGRNTGPLRN